MPTVKIIAGDQRRMSRSGFQYTSPMADRRAQVMAAAIDLLGDGGAKALTHRGVDQAAGVPQGTTANHFRTADALVAAVAIELERLDAEQWHQGASPSWTGITEAGRDIAKW